MNKNDKRLVPELRFPEFEHNWVIKKLGDVSSKIGSGKTPKGGEEVYQKVGIPFIRSQNINNDELIPDETHIPQEVHESMKGSQVVPNDILLNITGGSIGRSCVVPSNFKEGNVNQHVSIIRLKKDNPKFLQSILSSWRGQKLIYQGQTGSGREGLNFESIKGFKIHFPTISEQQKIATFLTSVDQRIQLLEKKKAKLEAYKKGVMQQIFSQEIRFKDENGKNYPDWEEKKLGELGEFKTSSVDKKIDENLPMVYLVNYMNVYRHETVSNDSRKNLMQVSATETQLTSNDLKKGDILFTPSSETPSDIGHSVVIFEDLENTLYSYHLMRFRPTIEIDILFSHYFCNTPNVLRQISRFATGSTRFTISVDSFSKISVKLPCIKEQQKIATFLSSIDKNIEQITLQIEKSKSFKKGLLQKMFV